MSAPRFRPLVRLHRIGRRCAFAAAILGALILFGTAIEATSYWSWPAATLPTAMTLVVVLVVVWAPFEAAFQVGEVWSPTSGEAVVGAAMERLRHLMVDQGAAVGGELPAARVGGSTAVSSMSDAELRAYLLGLHDRGVGGDPVA